jgi:hypothetical protein
MFDRRRLLGRLFYLLLALSLLPAELLGQGVTTTTVAEARWSQANDRNLVGRFGTQAFTVPRLAQTIFLRQYDASVPPKYSRYSTALHVDYPS